MRIVQLLPELNEGGVERGTVDLSRELVSAGHESFVISNGGKLAVQLESDGGKHIVHDVCSKNPFSAYRRMRKLRKIFQEIQPDVIHVRSRVPAWLSYWANQTLHLPFVTTVHGFNSVSLYSKIMTMGNRVICVSGAIKTYIQTHYHTLDEKIVVIPRGIDLDKFNPDRIDREFIETFREQNRLANNVVISTVGRITQLKDIETFIRAIAILKEGTPNIKALIVGGVREDKQEYFESLKSLVRELGMSDEVIFTGSQSNVAEIYALSDVVVSASKKPESFGRSVAEAIAMNTPVIATNHGGVLDIVHEGVNGYLVPIGNSEELASAIVKARILEFDGYTYIKRHFSLDQMVEKTMKLYKQVGKYD